MTNLSEKSSLYWISKGNEFFSRKNYEKSLESYKFALVTDPKNPIIWNNLGVLYERMNNFSEAIVSYETAFLLSNDDKYNIAKKNTEKKQNSFQKKGSPPAIENLSVIEKISKIDPNIWNKQIGTINLKSVRCQTEYPFLLLSVLLLFGFIALLHEIGPYIPFIYGLIAILYVRFNQGIILGNCIKITKENFPRLQQIITLNAKNCNIPEPELYIKQDPYLNAFTLGFRHPYVIVIHSSVIEEMDLQEIEMIINHEIGHAAFGHPKILSILSIMKNNSFSWFFYPIILIFGFWERAAEFSSDRIALILTGDYETALKTLFKIHIGAKIYSEVGLAQIYIQFKEVKTNVMNRLSELLVSHPFLTNRVHNIDEYSKALGIYKNILV